MTLGSDIQILLDEVLKAPDDKRTKDKVQQICSKLSLKQCDIDVLQTLFEAGIQIKASSKSSDIYIITRERDQNKAAKAILEHSSN